MDCYNIGIFQAGWYFEKAWARSHCQCATSRIAASFFIANRDHITNGARSKFDSYNR